MGLIIVTSMFWTPFLIYFWVTVMPLCIAPFWFNAHHVGFLNFIIEYRYVHSFSIFNQVLT
jgi:1,3-beta-glucan synthase